MSLHRHSHIRPSPSSRTMRFASPRASSLRAGWPRLRAAWRRFEDSAQGDILGAAALFIMIWPFIL